MPKIYQLGHALLWGYSYKRLKLAQLKLAQLLGQLGIFLTWRRKEAWLFGVMFSTWAPQGSSVREVHQQSLYSN